MHALKLTKRALMAAFALLLAAGGLAHAEDKGRVVLAISAVPGTHFYDYLLTFHSADGRHREDIRYGQDNWLFPSTRDFDDTKSNGVVKILDLAEGDWALTSYLVVTAGLTVRPKEDFSVPFTVKAGQTIYIGDYCAHVINGPDPDTGRMKEAVYFVVSDQSARDIPIAQKRDKQIVDVAATLPNVDAANVPLIRSTALPGG
jgi:hypothetical protein